MSGPKKIAVVVVGMHRSSTSALTRVLSLLGCDLPKTLMGPGSGNETGHWESQAICDLNDRILESGGSVWHDWQAFNPNWFRSPRADEFHDEALAVLADEFGKSRLFVLKDPRICRLAGFWFKALEAFGATPLAVLPVRNPLEVAASLAKRDGFDPSIGHLLWLRHALEAERATRGRPRVFVSYDGLMSGWRATMDRVQETLGLALPRVADASASAIESFLSEHLRHERIAPFSLVNDPGLSRWIRDSFAILDRWTQGDERPGDTATLEGIVAAFDAAVPAFVRPVETGRRAAASERRLEHELAAARTELAGRDTRIAGLEREAGTTGKELAEALARLAQAESALAQRRHEADESAQELAAARQDLRRLTEARTESETLLAGYKDHIALLLANERERQAALEALRQESTALRTALEEAGRREAEKRQLEHELAAVRSELTGRESRIAELEREAGAIGEELAEALARFTQMESALAQRRHEADESVQELAVARQDLRRQTEVRAKTEALLAGYEAHIALLLANEQERQAALEVLRQEAAALRTALEEAGRREAGKRRQDVEQEQALEALRRDVAGLRRQLEEKQQAAQAAASEAGQREARDAAMLKELSARNDELSRQNVQAAAELQKLVSGKHALERRLGERFDEIATLSGMIRDGESRTDTLRRSVAGLVAAGRVPALPLLGFRWWDRLRERREAEALTRAGLFDPAWYLENNPDVKKAGMDPAQHYLRHGIREGRAPCAAAVGR